MSQHPTEASVGTGPMVDYRHNSSLQQRMIESRDAALRDLVGRIGVVDGEFVIADYGCGPGQSAVQAVKPSIEAYRALSAEGPIRVRHCDQPSNDWNGLMALVYGPDGYGADAPHMAVEMGTGSFYEPMAADGTVRLASCFAASHWLSRALYVSSPGTCFFSDLTGPAREAMAALARDDWTLFLRRRARELKPGGYLIVSTLGSVPDPSERNGTFASARKLYRAVFRVTQTMADDGLVSQRAVDEFVFPLWFPGAADLDAPLEADADLRAAFERVATTVEPAPGAWRDAFQHEIGDPARYAALYTGYTRGFAESALRTHLFARSASAQKDVDALLGEFFHRFRALYETEPGAHASETMIATQILRRTAKP